jgi:hypothetical protein
MASKTMSTVSRFGTQNRKLRFGVLGLKITTMVSCFGPQNQVGHGLSVVPQNRWEDVDGMGHTSRSSGLLHLEASWARVSQCGLKTGRGMAWMVHVASSWTSHGDEAEDGRSMRWATSVSSTLTLPLSLY